MDNETHGLFRAFVQRTENRNHRMPFRTPHAEPAHELFAGYHVQMMHTERATVMYVRVEAGKPFPEHAHPHEQVTNVLEGEFEMTVGGETRVLRSGECAVIPPNVLHTGRAITPCRLIDVFTPVREDYVARFG